jgi:hypothetical protein
MSAANETTKRGGQRKPAVDSVIRRADISLAFESASTRIHFPEMR